MKPYHWVVICLLMAVASCQTTCETQPDVVWGGRVQSLATHPIYGDHLLAGSETGGLFQSTDSGATWHHLDALPSYLVTAVAYSPTSPSIVLVTTTAGFYAPTSGGIWRSTNEGSSWTKVASGTPAPSARCPTRSGAYALSFEPGGGTVYAASDCGLAISTDDGATWTFTSLDPARPAGTDSVPDRVWSVLAGPGGRANVAAASGLWWRSNGTTAWQRNNTPNGGAQAWIIHAFAASPFNPAHVFLAAYPQSLYLSTNGGQSWTQVTAPSVWNRGVFVRTGVRSGLATNHFEVYWGSGNTLYRQDFTSTVAGPTGSGTWAAPSVDHADPADVAFASGTAGPVLLATDGGVHRTPNGGQTWTLSGGGKHGLNALQITELTGQDVSGSSKHQDLYYGTQDNNIVASADGGATWPNSICCEGFYLRVPPTSVDHNTSKVTGVTCGACMNFRTDQHLTNFAGFPNPPDGDTITGDIDGNPFLIGAGRYIQNTINNDVAPLVNHIKRTENNGGSWSNGYDIPEELRGRPIIVGPDTSPTIWQPIRRPGFTTAGAERVELARITGLYAAGGPTVTYVDLPGTGSLGVFPTMFAWYWVFGVDRFQANHLIVPDIESRAMLTTNNAGGAWSTDAALTQLVTNSGGRYFTVSGIFPNVHMIDWDPGNRCHVLVGTAEGGVFRSVNAGGSWAYVDGSDRITNLSSFYFPQSGDVKISSYGRGLWRIRVSRDVTCRLATIPADTIFRGPRLADFRTVPPRLRFDPHKPPPCIRCGYLVVRYGRITGVTLEGSRLTRVRVTGGEVQQLDASWREVPLRIESDIVSGPADFSNHQGLAALARAGESIRALKIAGDSIQGAIVSDYDLETPPRPVPYVRVLTADMASGMPRIRSGEEITIVGEGFAAPGANVSPVVLRIGGEEQKARVEVDKRGVFRVRLRVEQMPGDYVVEVEQRDGRRVMRDRSRFLVVPDDRPPRQRGEPDRR